MTEKKGEDKTSEELDALLINQVSESGDTNFSVTLDQGSAAEDDLGALLKAETSGTPGSIRSSEDSTGSASDLSGLLRSEYQHSSSSLKTSALPRKIGADSKDISDTLNEYLSDAEYPSQQAQQASIEQHNDSELENLLRGSAVKTGTQTKGKKRKVRVQQKKELADQVLQGNRATVLQKKAVLSFIFFLVVSLGFYFVSNESLPEPDRILYDLADEVTRYEEETGTYPTSLRQLASFPTDHLEWAIENWDLRNAEGLGEVIWVDEGVGFAIILRNRFGIWVYDSSSSRVKKETESSQS